METLLFFHNIGGIIMGKKWERSSEELIEQFHSCMEQFPKADKRKMFGYPCCFVNNNMFIGLREQNCIIRLPEDQREELIASYQAVIFEPMQGRPMREYVVLPQKIRQDSGLLKERIGKSLDFVLSLPPKIPKKRKSKKKTYN